MNSPDGVADLMYESCCRGVALQRLYKGFEIIQNHFNS